MRSEKPILAVNNITPSAYHNAGGVFCVSAEYVMGDRSDVIWPGRFDRDVAAKWLCLPSYRFWFDILRLVCSAQALTCPVLNTLYQRMLIRSDLLANGVSKG